VKIDEPEIETTSGGELSGLPGRAPRGGAGGAAWRTRVTRIMGLARSPLCIHEALVRRRFRAAGLAEHQVDLGNASVRCWAGGNGPPVLLLHGFGASALWQWYPQVPALARRFTLILPDLLFFGRSTTESADRSIRFQAETVLRVASHFFLATFDVVGLSYGGFVALEAAAQEPDRVRRICLVGSPGTAMQPEDHQALLERFGVPHVRNLLIPCGASGVRQLIRIAWHRPPYVPEFILRDTYRTLFCGQTKEQAELLDSLMNELGRPVDIPRPFPHETLILWGEYDPIFPLHLAERLKGQLGGSAECRVLKNTAHAPNMEKPAEFNQRLLEFLSR
jgi:pimeloyl-ACP methyl ester carboxylesterase